MKRMFAPILSAVLVCGLAAGCGSGSKASADGGSKKKVVFVSALTSEPNWANLNKCFTDTANKGGLNASVVGPASTVDIPGMVSTLEQVIAQHPDAIVTAPLTDPAFQGVLQKAYEQKIPVISVVYLGNQHHELAVVGVDTTIYANTAADLLNKQTSGNAKIGILSIVSSAFQISTIKAFKEAIKKYPGLQIVDEESITSDLNASAEVARSMLVAHPNIDTVWGPDGFSGPSAVIAEQELGKGRKVTIMSGDIPAQTAKAIKDGTIFATLVKVDCSVGEKAAQVLVDHFNGKDPESPMVLLAPALYTKDNLNDLPPALRPAGD